MQSLWMLVASFLFAVMAACVKYASPDVGALSIVFWRGLFGVLMLAAWALASGRCLATRMPWSHFKRSGLGTVALALWLVAVTQLPLATSMTLNYTSPLFMAGIVAGLALKRHQSVSWPLIAATAIGFLGVIQILRPEFHAGQEWAAVAGAVSGLLSALAYFQIRELTDLKEPAWRVVFYFSVFNLVFGLSGHWLLEPADQYSQAAVIGIVGAGLSATLAQVAMTLAFGTGNLLVSAIFSFSGIIFACLFGFLFFGDSLSAQTLIGIAIIIITGICATVLTKRARH